MKGAYYSSPVMFQDLIAKKELQKTNIENSIAQHINLIITTSFGEVKFNEIFGCKIWDSEFDLLVQPKILKENIKKEIKDAVMKYETRLDVQEVTISIDDTHSISYNRGKRIKRKVNVIINGSVRLTNRPFKFYSHFFIGPLSYA
jgi:phage baseplate assembly protein W